MIADFSRLSKRIRIALIAGISCAASNGIVAARVDARAAVSALAAGSSFDARRLRHGAAKPMHPTGTAAASGGTTYSITDYGVPPGSPQAVPAAFDNAGLIIGNAVNPKKGAVDCELATGPGKFVDLSPTGTDTACFAGAMSNVSASGTLAFVGSLSTELQGPIAFIGTYSTRTRTGTLHPFPAVTLSLGGVTISGEAVGAGLYLPLGWTSAPLAAFESFLPTSTAPFVVPANETTVDVMQPTCAPLTSAHLCGSLSAGTNFQTGDTFCPFGGCQINDAGTILLTDASNGHLMTYTYGKSGSARDLPIVPADAVISYINNANEVASAILTSTGNYQTLLYTITKNTSTLIPPVALSVPGASYCEPISLSNAGEILGSCSNNNDFVYWTWDAKHGVKNLTNEIPASSAFPDILPFGINDSGQILAQLIEPSGTIHWGILNPPASLTTPNAAARAVK